MTTINELYNYADQEGVTVAAFSLNKREALSTMDTDGQCYVAIDPNKVTSSADEKTKLAHELGHCMTGSFYNIYSPCDSRQRHENRADRWAIKKLITEDELERAVKKGYTELWELAEFFNVTEDLMRKAVSLYKYGNLYSV